MVGTRLSFFSFKYRLYSNSCNLMCAHVCTFMVSTSGSWDPLGMGPYIHSYLNKGSMCMFFGILSTQGCTAVEIKLGNRIKGYLWRYMEVLLFYTPILLPIIGLSEVRSPVYPNCNSR